MLSRPIKSNTPNVGRDYHKKMREQVRRNVLFLRGFYTNSSRRGKWHGFAVSRDESGVA